MPNTTPSRTTRPYIYSTDTVKTRPEQGNIGYDDAVDIHIRIGGISVPNIIVNIAWSLDPKTKDVTKAETEVYQAGFGWAKLLPVTGFGGNMVKIRGKIIQFERRMVITVPLTPITEKIDQLHAENRWPILIRGVLDTSTYAHKAEMIYV